MTTDYNLPNLGEGVEGGDVIEVVVSAGDQVEEGQTLLELETSKATIPVPAPHPGRITKVHVKPGDHVAVGQVLVTLDDGSPAADAKPAELKAQKKEKQPFAKPGPPASTRAQSASEGPEESDSRLRVGRVSQQAAEPEPPAVPTEPVPAKVAEEHSAQPPETQMDLIAAGPATRRLARELGVDLHRVTGSGPGGRMSEDDVKAYVRQSGASRAMDRPASRGASSQPPPLPDFSRWGPVTRELLEPVRRKTAEHMSLAWSLIPQVTHFDQADITDLESFRKRHAARTEARGGKLTVTAVTLKAVAVALQAFPRFCSSLDSTSGELILKQYCHIGVAVETERGLMVPVIRDVAKKSILQLAAELSAVAERARQKKVTLEDLQGGTFTITNIGGIGGTGFSPIVNYPEVAILGLARAREQQVVRDGQLAIRLILPLCLTYDHRVIDGADAARFTRLVAELLEDPFRMALEG